MADSFDYISDLKKRLRRYLRNLFKRRAVKFLFFLLTLWLAAAILITYLHYSAQF